MKEDMHFMTDMEVIKQIIRAAGIRRNETVLEIGPGHGELTELIAKKAKRVIAIEKDRGLASLLKEKFRRNAKVAVMRGNALREIRNFRYDKIISNLPYSICQPLFQLLPHADFRAAFLALPEKFSERLFHLPYSCLLETEILFRIPKNSFSPPPRTRSVFVKTFPRREKSLLGLVLGMGKSKAKNAIMRALHEGKGLSRKQARQALKTPELNTLLEKRVSTLDSGDFETLKKFLKRFK
jgi:16S rRNA (adenine1518-N6/adenine1519-N6)-dimethyltransferase